MGELTRLKQIREERELTQQQLAEVIKTTQSYYAQYENGKRPIPFDRMIEIAKFLNVSLDYIAELTNKKKINR